MQQISAILRFLFSIYALVLFIIYMLLVFPLVIAASFFGKINGGNFIYKLSRWWTDFLLFFMFIRPQYINERARPNAGKQYVFVFNHISYIDILFLFKAIRRQHFRVLGKAELAKIPVFGFIYRSAVVLVDRSSAAARAKSVRQLKAVLRKGISIIIAPEGTFNMTGKPLKEFYDGAFKIAIETQTPIKPVLFLDAYNRLPYKPLLSLNPGKARIMYLDEIPVKEYTLNDIQLLKEKVFGAMEEMLILHNASWIKNEQTG